MHIKLQKKGYPMRYKTTGVCAQAITFEIDNNKITSINFERGCDGNTTGICKLVEGMEVDDVIHRLEGITCGARKTSCPDQLANALKEYKKSL